MSPITGRPSAMQMTTVPGTFSLPMHPYLEQAEQQQIIDAVLEAL